MAHSNNLLQSHSSYQQYDKMLTPSNPVVRNFSWANSSYFGNSTMMNSATSSVPLSYMQQNPQLNPILMPASNYTVNNTISVNSTANVTQNLVSIKIS